MRACGCSEAYAKRHRRPSSPQAHCARAHHRPWPDALPSSIVTVTATDNGGATLDVVADHSGRDEAVRFTNKVDLHALSVTKAVQTESKYAGADDSLKNPSFPLLLDVHDANNSSLHGIAYDVYGTGGSIVLADQTTSTDATTGKEAAQIKVGQTVAFKGLSYGSAWKVEEGTMPQGWKFVQASADGGTIEDGAATTLTNTYDAVGGMEFKAKKTLNGGAPVAKAFQFVLYRGDHTAPGAGLPVDDLVGTVSNGDGGSVSFSSDEFPELACGLADVGTQRTYTIVEVNGGNDAVAYDLHGILATVTVADNGDGTLAVMPTYTGSTTFENTTTMRLAQTGAAGVGAASAVAVVVGTAATFACRRRRKK